MLEAIHTVTSTLNLNLALTLMHSCSHIACSVGSALLPRLLCTVYYTKSHENCTQMSNTHYWIQHGSVSDPISR